MFLLLSVTSVGSFWYSEQTLYRTYSRQWTEERAYLCGGEWVERTVTVRNVLEHRRGRIAVSQEVVGDSCPVEKEDK